MLFFIILIQLLYNEWAIMSPVYLTFCQFITLSIEFRTFKPAPTIVDILAMSSMISLWRIGRESNWPKDRELAAPAGGFKVEEISTIVVVGSVNVVLEVMSIWNMNGNDCVVMTQATLLVLCVQISYLQLHTFIDRSEFTDFFSFDGESAQVTPLNLSWKI
jgi:hypothetical protein